MNHGRERCVQTLAALFTMAGALVDTNGDGYADDIALRFIVTGEPTAWEWCALADLAAVLGLHVTGFSPPLVVDSWDGPTLLLDAGNDAALEPGSGRATLDGDRITVRGGDAAGRAAILRALAQGSAPEAAELHVTAAQYPEPTPRPAPADPGPPLTDLTDLFMVHGDPDRFPGLLTDTDGDRLADDTRCCFVVGENISHKIGTALIDLAARLGVETAGLTVPLCAPIDLGAAVPIFINNPRLDTERFLSSQLLDDGRTAIMFAGWVDDQIANPLRSLASSTPIKTIMPGFIEPQPAKEAIWSWEWEGHTEREVLLAELHEHYLPLPNNNPCNVVIQVSEDAEQRAAIRDELLTLFPEGSTITVLPVHHAGRAWLEEVVAPAAKELRGLAALEVTCRPLDPPEDRLMLNMQIFWLQECWPADEIIAPMLELPLEQVRITLGTDDQDGIYNARALDAAGAVMKEWTFWPASSWRPYLLNDEPDRWVVLGASNITIEQARAPSSYLSDFGTDLERFYFEGWWPMVLPRLREYALAQHAAGATQPFFDELRIEVWVSEAEYALGVREERESPGEGLAEDLYFNTLDFFHELGIQTTGEPWDEPGQIVPLVHIAPGEPPRAKVTLYRYNEAETTYTPIPVQQRESGVAMDEVVTGANLPGLLAYIDRFDAVTVRGEGRSYRGRRLVSIEVVKPDGAAVRSRAKLAAMKPTHLFVARHHANEVSSTTAAFRLIELLASNPEIAPLLDRNNVIVIPDENPDGTALHAELMAEHPTWKHHAARYNAVGVEHSFHMWNPHTPYGEALIRPILWQLWRPDVITDNHGVPSHEWWQPFAGGQNPPRFGISYWLCQALIYGICRHPPDAPHAAFAAAMRDAVSRAIAADPEIAAANAVYAERYARWGHQYVPEKFPATYHGDMLWFFGPAEAQPGSPRRNVAVQEAAMLSASWVTEVIDETAQGDHLALVAKAHLTANLALLRMTAENAPPVAFSATPLPGGYVHHRLHRMRPLPAPAIKE